VPEGGGAEAGHRMLPGAMPLMAGVCMTTCALGGTEDAGVASGAMAKDAPLSGGAVPLACTGVIMAGAAMVRPEGVLCPGMPEPGGANMLAVLMEGVAGTRAMADDE